MDSLWNAYVTWQEHTDNINPPPSQQKDIYMMSERCLTKTSNTSGQDILQMSKRSSKCKSERHLHKTSWRYLCKIYYRCLTEEALRCLINLSWRCIEVIWRCLTDVLIEDDLQMPCQKMSCRCLIEDDLQMSYQKISCMRCLKDVFIISLCFI